MDLDAITQVTGETQGVRSIFVIGRDNSGNYVTSEIHSISFTLGSEAPTVEISSGFLDFDLNESDFNITLGVNDSITEIVLEIPVGENLLAAEISIEHPSGYGAELEATIETDPFSADFGKLTGFTVISGGQGFDEGNTTIEVIPLIRAINEGIPAEAGATFDFEFNATSGVNDFSSVAIALRQNIDGSLRTGSGYIIAPRLVVPPYTFLVYDGRSYQRVPLAPSTTNTSSVEPFFIGPLDFLIDGAELVGGFTQSPVIIEVEANSTNEAIESVSLVIDGQTDEDLTKSSPALQFQLGSRCGKELFNFCDCT